MKKSKLKKIIKKSVKETLNEFHQVPHNEAFVAACNCNEWDLAQNICYKNANGPFGTYKMNVAVVPQLSTISNLQGAAAGDIMCYMDNVLNGGAINQGNINDCIKNNPAGIPGPSKTRKVIQTLSGGTNNSGFAQSCLLPPTTPCGIGCTDSNYQNYNPLASHPCNSSGYGPTADPNLDNDCCGQVNIYGCTDSTANNYNAFANTDDGSCFYVGCADPTAVNYDPNDDGCGIPPDPNNISCCDYEGCTDSAAENYDPLATIDDGNCYGCVDPTAVNYVLNAVADCSGIPGNTPQDNSCCNYSPIPGCIDPTACNYDPSATVDDGSCEYVSCAGCTDPLYCNYDPNATIDDGSCSGYYGCTDPTATNYDMNAGCDDGSCTYPIPVEGCADPSAVHCSQQPPALQQLTNCYRPTNTGCDGDPNDTSCCLYEARDRDRDVTPGCTPPPGGCPPGHLWNPYPVCQCLRMSIDPRGDDPFIDNDDEDRDSGLLPCDKFFQLPIIHQQGCCLKCEDPSIYPSHSCYPYCHCCKFI